MGSCPFHSLNCGLLPPSIVRHLCHSCPHSLMGSSILFIYLFIYYHYYYYYYYLLSRSFPSHCGGSFPSQWSSSTSHCGLLPFSLSHWGSSLPQHGPLSHRTQVRGSSPSSRGGVLSLLLRGLSSISAVRLSLFLSRGSPSLLGAHPHLIHSTVGLPHIAVGLPHIAVELFTISTWGFFSLWGSSPSRSLNCGASPHLCGALPHLNCGAYPHLCGTLRGASSRCGALPHLAHSTAGLPHISVGLFPISLTQLRGFPTSLWGSSPSRSLNCGASPHLCGALPHLNCGAYPHLCGTLHHLSVGLHLAVGLFPILLAQLWGFSTSLCGSLSPLSVGLGGSSLSGSLNCTLTQLWHSTGSCILLLAPARGGGLLPPPPTHLISPFPSWGSLTELRGKPCFPMSLTDPLPSLTSLMYHTKPLPSRC